MAEEKESRPSPVDVHVGARIRLRRTLMGMSQEKLGDSLGLTFQQVQKYERGANRVGASRLFDLSRVLDVPICYFYDNMAQTPGGGATPAARPVTGFADTQAAFNEEPQTTRETMELVRAYYRIVDPIMRKRIYDLMKSMAPSDD